MSIVHVWAAFQMTRAKRGDWGILKKQHFTELSFETNLNKKLMDCEPVRTREQMSKSFPLLKAFKRIKNKTKQHQQNLGIHSNTCLSESISTAAGLSAAQGCPSTAWHSLPYSRSPGDTLVIANVVSLCILKLSCL